MNVLYERMLGSRRAARSPPGLESCTAITHYQNAEGGGKAISGFFFPTLIQHRKLSKQTGSITQVQSMTIISIVLKGRLIALELVKSRTEVLRNIRGWHF